MENRQKFTSTNVYAETEQNTFETPEGYNMKTVNPDHIATDVFMPKDCIAKILFDNKNNTPEKAVKINNITDPQFEYIIAEILHQIGVPAHVKGYTYLRQSILLCIRNTEFTNSITTKLYPVIAKKNNTTISRVERAIRHAIEIACKRGAIGILNTNFGYTLEEGRKRPSNGEFIATLSDKIRLQINLI